MEILYTIGAIVACILLFSAAICIHEFGHFLAARKLGLKVDAFSIGFGPALWKKKINGVEYRIGAIWLGGYVLLPQLDPEGTKKLEGAKKEEDTSADEDVVEIAAWKKIVVAFAGPFGNIVLAVVLAVLLALVPSAKFGELSTEIGRVVEKGPAAEGGVKAGDIVTAVNGHAVDTWNALMTEVQIAGTNMTALTVRRGSELKTLSVRPKRDAVSGACFIMALSTTNASAQAAFWMPNRNPLKQLAWDANGIFRILKALVTPKESKAAAQALGGPVMIAEGLYRQVRRNVWDAFGFLRFLCVNLAILNLLPIPVLDGGLILFALYELLLRRKTPKVLTDTLTKIFMVLLLCLMGFLIYRDVMRSVRVHRATGETKSVEETK